MQGFRKGDDNDNDDNNNNMYFHRINSVLETEKKKKVEKLLSTEMRTMFSSTKPVSSAPKENCRTSSKVLLRACE